MRQKRNRALILTAVAAAGVAVGCGSAPSGDPSGSGGSGSSSVPTVQEVMADPGTVVNTIPAGAALPEIAKWQLMLAHGGVTIAGIGKASGAPELAVVFAVEPSSATEYTVNGAELAESPSLHYSPEAVIQALQADIAASQSSETAQSASSIRVQDELVKPCPFPIIPSLVPNPSALACPGGWFILMAAAPWACWTMGPQIALQMMSGCSSNANPY